MVREYTLPLGQKLNPQPNPHTMDYKKLHNHIAKRYDIYLFEDEIKEIVDIVLEMHNENPETCTKKTYNQGWSEGFKAGWKASLEEMKVRLKQYKEAEQGFSEYQQAMDEAIELIDWLSGNKKDRPE